ncbi:hypothetical protein K438DRAFT_2024760 [Mycena galopus ATCC 62051]|nr:hypothetical protein K438DRAFT_2024760 [Mycena galopus ATCC 62051]
MPPNIQPRDSIYYLSSLASALQNSELSNETSANRDDTLATNLSGVGRTLNHLSTSLTRGISTEPSKIIAVTACVLESGVSVAIATSPYVSLSDSATISPSSSAGVEEESGQNPSESDGASPCEPLRSVSKDESNSIPSSATTEVERMVFARNSSDAAGQHSLINLDSDAVSLPLLDTILALKSCGPDSIPVPTEFPDFVAESFSLLRSAAARLSSHPSTADIREAVCLYFLSACRPKLENRMGTIESSYDLSKLLTGRPPNARRTELSSLGSMPKERSLSFSTPAMCTPGGRFWFLAVHPENALVDKDMKHVYEASVTLHDFVQKIPVALWAMNSLADHLEIVEKRFVASMQHTDLDVSPAALKSRNSDDIEEEDGIDETLPEGNSFCQFSTDSFIKLAFSSRGRLNAAAVPECVVFKRVVDAVCAWTTGPTHLLRSKIARSPIVTSVSILDLPSAPISAISYKDLIAYWSKTTHWSSAKLKKATSAIQRIRDQDLDRVKGACHCEAGLMASLLLRSNPDHSPVNEPSAVSRAFQNLQCPASPIMIGVAKKCCPVCRMLSESLRSRHQLSIELPGQHSRYFPWVPPHWLPIDVLQDVEARLLQVVTSMLMEEEHLASSRSSTPASDNSASSEEHRGPSARHKAFFIQATSGVAPDKKL